MRGFPSFDRFCDLADEIVRQIPDMYKKGISGIFVLPEEVRDEEIPELYILGHYHHGGFLEPSIDIYYGSFRQVFRGLPRARLEEELWETITHEIRHHLEENAGLHNLEVFDQQQKEYFRSNK
jgi:hypothetical protein